MRFNPQHWMPDKAEMGIRRASRAALALGSVCCREDRFIDDWIDDGICKPYDGRPRRVAGRSLDFFLEPYAVHGFVGSKARRDGFVAFLVNHLFWKEGFGIQGDAPFDSADGREYDGVLAFDSPNPFVALWKEDEEHCV